MRNWWYNPLSLLWGIYWSLCTSSLVMNLCTLMIIRQNKSLHSSQIKQLANLNVTSLQSVCVSILHITHVIYHFLISQIYHFTIFISIRLYYPCVTRKTYSLLPMMGLAMSGRSRSAMMGIAKCFRQNMRPC